MARETVIWNKIMFKYFLIFAAFCCLCFASTTASSAPFCVEAEGLSPECWYHDVRSCRQEAQKRNGHCSVNVDEVVVLDQGAPFCIVDSGMMPVCAFQGGESCHEEAAKRNAVCFQNTSIEESYDPYRLERPAFNYR